MSTESTWSETTHQLSQRGMINLRKCGCLLHWLSWHVVSFHVDSVDVESHSALAQLMESWLCVDSVWGRWIKPKQAYMTSSGTFKGIEFGKINLEMFRWVQYQPENVKSFYIAWSKQLTLRNWVNAELWIIQISWQIQFYIRTNLEYESGDQLGAFNEKKAEVKNLVQVYLYCKIN